MAERTAKDFAVEHGRYLADAADAYMAAINSGGDYSGQADAWKRLRNAVYEFRKRADAASREGTNA